MRVTIAVLFFCVILAVVAPSLLALPNLNATECGNEGKSRILVANVQKAAELWHVKRGTYPSKIEELVTPSLPGEFPELDRIPLDPWGTQILYEYPNSKSPGSGLLAIWSAGKNRKNENGAGDDINNWTDSYAAR